MSELKPCPFCTGEAHTGFRELGGGRYISAIFCLECNAQTVGADNSHASNVAAWNRRAPVAKPGPCTYTPRPPTVAEQLTPAPPETPAHHEGPARLITRRAPGWQEGAEAMREAVIKRIGHDWFSAADIVRALPLPEPPK